MLIAVLGAAGAMAQVVVRDLLEMQPGIEVTAADRRRPEHDHPRVRCAEIDVEDVAATAELLRGHNAVLGVRTGEGPRQGGVQVDYPIRKPVQERCRQYAHPTRQDNPIRLVGSDLLDQPGVVFPALRFPGLRYYQSRHFHLAGAVQPVSRRFIRKNRGNPPGQLARSAGIQVTAHGGEVVVAGSVSSSKMVDAVTRIAEGVDGVKSVRCKAGVGTDWSW